MNDESSWRLFATGTMLLLFFGLLILVEAFDTFLSRFLPIFLGLLCAALIGYGIVALILRTILHARQPQHPDEHER